MKSPTEEKKKSPTPAKDLTPTEEIETLEGLEALHNDLPEDSPTRLFLTAYGGLLIGFAQCGLAVDIADVSIEKEEISFVLDGKTNIFENKHALLAFEDVIKTINAQAPHNQAQVDTLKATLLSSYRTIEKLPDAATVQENVVTIFNNMSEVLGLQMLTDAVEASTRPSFNPLVPALHEYGDPISCIVMGGTAMAISMGAGKGTHAEPLMEALTAFYNELEQRQIGFTRPTLSCHFYPGTSASKVTIRNATSELTAHICFNPHQVFEHVVDNTKLPKDLVDGISAYMSDISGSQLPTAAQINAAFEVAVTEAALSFHSNPSKATHPTFAKEAKYLCNTLCNFGIDRAKVDEAYNHFSHLYLPPSGTFKGLMVAMVNELVIPDMRELVFSEISAGYSQQFSNQPPPPANSPRRVEMPCDEPPPGLEPEFMGNAKATPMWVEKVTYKTPGDYFIAKIVELCRADNDLCQEVFYVQATGVQTLFEQVSGTLSVFWDKDQAGVDVLAKGFIQDCRGQFPNLSEQPVKPPQRSIV